MENSVFATLNAINCNEHTEKKNGLTYLSWAWAWAEVKKAYPTATYKIYEDPNGCFYFTDGRTCWVKTGVIIEGIEHIEYLPVMDYNNRSIPKEKVTSFDVNKAIQRSLTKAAARHGLGLYIYAGEDLPEAEAPKATEDYSSYTRPVAKEANQIIEEERDALLLMASGLGIDLHKLATYLKKAVTDLTNDDLRNAIDQKQRRISR